MCLLWKLLLSLAPALALRPHAVPRRQWLAMATGSPPLFFASQPGVGQDIAAIEMGGGAGQSQPPLVYTTARAAAKTSAKTRGPAKPLVDVPLRRLRLPRGAFGRDYVIVGIEVEGKELEFLLDTGLSLEMVTPALKDSLRLSTGHTRVEGSSAGGTFEYDVVELASARVEGVALPPLHATVADFPMEHVDPAHDVTGMLGLEFVRLFDVDLDCSANRLRLWNVGEGTAMARRENFVEIPARFDGTVLMVRAAGHGTQQPFVGIVDSGASVSVLSTGAAELAGIDAKTIDTLRKSPTAPAILGLGVDKTTPLKMPLVDLRLDLKGGLVTRDDGQVQGFETLVTFPPGLRVAVGDLPVFSDILGPRLAPYAAILGMDVWSHGRTLFQGGDRTGPTSLFHSDG